MKDFLSVTDFDADELAAVLARAAAVKQDPGSVAGRHAGTGGLTSIAPCLRSSRRRHHRC